MLIISTESPTIVRTKMIYLYINGIMVDKLKSKQVKKYNLEPGKYQIQVRLNFYVSEPVIIEIKPKKKVTYGITLKSNWTLFTVILPLMLLGAGIYYFLSKQFGSTSGYIFMAIYFSVVFYVNSKFNRKGYLELNKMKNNYLNR